MKLSDNLLETYFGKDLDNDVIHWMSLGFINHDTEFLNEEAKKVQQNGGDDAIDVFAKSQNGDCTAYLLRFCLHLIESKIAAEEDLILVEGTCTVCKRRKTSKSYVPPYQEEDHFGLEMKISHDKFIFLDPAKGFWIIFGAQDAKIHAEYTYNGPTGVKYESFYPNDKGIYFSPTSNAYDFKVKERHDKNVIQLLRGLVSVSIDQHLGLNKSP